MFFMATRHFITIVVAMQQVASQQYYSEIMMIVTLIMEANQASRRRCVRVYGQASGFMKRQHLGNYLMKMFK
jgi:hypothetical protein